jgi:hypothetical protein
VETAFDIAQALSNQNAAQMAREDEGYESEDEHDVEDPALQNSNPSTSSSASTFFHSAAQPACPSPVNSAPTALRPELTRKQRHSKDSRARRRSTRQQSLPLDMRHLKSITLKRRRNLVAIPAPTDAEDLHAASTGWIGARIPNDESTYTLEEVTAAPYNLRHVQWDGR